MRPWLSSLLAVCLLPALVNAQPVKAPPAHAQDGPPKIGPQVTIEVEIIEVSPKVERLARLEGEDDDFIARLRELEKGDKLASHVRLRLTTLDQNLGSIQSGGRAPIVTSRSEGFGRRGEQISSSLRDFGTLLTATPRVEAAGSILVELTLERSAPPDRASGEREGAPRDPADPNSTNPAGALIGGPMGSASAALGENRLATRASVRVKDGQTVLLHGVETLSGNAASQTVVLLTARATEAGVAVTTTSQELKIFTLRQASAKPMASVLLDLYKSSLTVSADERTNTLLVVGPQDKLKEVEAILLKLDEK